MCVLFCFVFTKQANALLKRREFIYSPVLCARTWAGPTQKRRLMQGFNSFSLSAWRLETFPSIQIVNQVTSP